MNYFDYVNGVDEVKPKAKPQAGEPLTVETSDIMVSEFAFDDAPEYLRESYRKYTGRNHA